MKHRLSFPLILLLAAGLLVAACQPASASFAQLDAPAADASAVPVEAVRVEIGVGSPRPVTAVVNGSLAETCAQLGQMSQLRQGSTFQIALRAVRPDGADCQPASLPFELRLPLNTVNLAAGDYTVSVNGTQATFTLESGSESATAQAADSALISRDAQIDQVEVMTEGSQAVKSVRAMISGVLPDTCAQVGEVSLSRREAVFEVGVVAQSTPGSDCLVDSLPFRLEIPLNLVGLPAEPYQVIVNGVTADFDPRATSGEGKPGLAALVKPAADAGGVVNVEALNLRLGPGLDYKVYRVLRYAQTLRLLGRSADSQWVEVRLPDGSGGWVYAAYVTSDTPIGGLPLTEASGGPEAPDTPAAFSCAATPWDLCMTINDDQATVFLQKFPANATVIVGLRPVAGGATLEVARGQIDAQGVAQITFAMPSHWADGRAVTEQQLLLSAGTPDKKFNRSATVSYIQ